MSGRWAILTLVVGCGRIGFDGIAPIGDGGSGPGCIASLALGQASACVVREDGALYCWGDDSNGQLGIGRRTSITLPSAPLGIAATSLTAGARHTCALGVTTAWCWGDNSYGQLGDGTTQTRTTPTPIALAFPQVISAGEATTCAIDGSTAMCWGKNHAGQIGDGTKIHRSQPTPVANLGNVIAIATGVNHTCAIDAANNVWCWGANAHGQLGTGTFSGSMMPARVANNFRATQLTVGEQFTCAVDLTNRLWCWGSNNNGQLGNDDMGNDSNVPVQVATLGTNIVDVDAGSVHACAVLATGNTRCWGRNVSRLGNGDSASSATPVLVSNLPDAVEAAIGENSTCARRISGAVRCWGQNDAGELGTDAFGQQDTATDSAAMNTTSIALGGAHACAVIAGDVVCWGANTFGELGTGDTPSPLVPTRITGGIASATVGRQHACARHTDGTLSCWGLNFARLGFEDPTEVFEPTPVPGLANIVEVHAGSEVTCARDAAGEVTCWGAARAVGSNQTLRLPTPTPVSNLAPASALVAGEAHGCAIDAATHTASCWGANGDGRLGNGMTGDALVPTPVVDLGAVDAITSGNHNGCARLPNGELWCWGDNSNGELAGASTAGVNRRPVNIGIVADAVYAGDSYACSRTGTELTCWGNNAFGVLGDPVYVDARAPGPVPGLAARTMASGGSYSCAITPDDDVWCWGHNGFGELGDGTTIDRSTPMRVDVPCD